MKNFVAILVCMTICLFSSCLKTNDSDRGGATVSIDLEKSKQFISDEESSLIVPDECAIIQLDCHKQLGSIEDVKFNGDRMVVMDNGRQGLHVLNSRGICEHEIFHLGKSSNEYIEITDYCATDESIYILDMSSQKVLEYAYDGTSKGVTGISSYWANQFFVIDDHIYLVNNGSDTKNGQYHIFEIEKDGSLVKSHIEFGKSFGFGDDGSKVFYAKDSVFYADRLSNTIFRISSGKCEPYIHLDFGKYNLPEQFVELDARQLMKQTNGEYKKYVLGIEGMQASGNLLFVKFQQDSDNYLLVLDHKKKAEVLLCRGIVVKNMYRMGLVNYYIHDEYIYNVYDGDDFVNFVNNMDMQDDSMDNRYYIQLKEIVSERSEDPGNPIIIRYKIRNE